MIQNREYKLVRGGEEKTFSYQKEIAEYLGCSTQYVNMIYKGKTKIDGINIIRTK